MITSIFFVLLSLIPFYLIGTFPTGYLIAKGAGIDISTKGSGNVGATNVARALGKKAGIITLGVDIFKGVLAVTIAKWIGAAEWFPSLVAATVVCGHCFSLPPYLKGGKGVATSLGAVSALDPLVALCAVLLFAALFLWKKIVSLASVTAALGAPIAAFILERPEAVSAALAVISLIIIYRHKANLDRISKGIEPRMGVSSAGTNSRV